MTLDANQQCAQFEISDDVLRPPLSVRLRDRTLSISWFHRSGTNGTLVYLHGLGSSKGDLAPALAWSALRRWSIIAYDAPGSGGSPYPAEGDLTLDHLCDLAAEIIKSYAIAPVVLIGHSMGGLTGLLLAHRQRHLVSAFVNVEGNLAPVDCSVFSRRALAFPASAVEDEFFPILQAEFAGSGLSGLDVFARRFQSQVTPRAFHDYCRSIVDYSDHHPLFDYFLRLNVPRLYVYGSENRHLPHPKTLRETAVTVAEIPNSNHFPLYSNPSFFLDTLAGFVSTIAG